MRFRCNTQVKTGWKQEVSEEQVKQRVKFNKNLQRWLCHQNKRA